MIFDNGYALIKLKDSGYVPDRVKSIVLVYNGEKYVGQIVNATSSEIPPKGECWILVKFNTTLTPNDRAKIVLHWRCTALRRTDPRQR